LDNESTLYSQKRDTAAWYDAIRGNGSSWWLTQQPLPQAGDEGQLPSFLHRIASHTRFLPNWNRRWHFLKGNHSPSSSVDSIQTKCIKNKTDNRKDQEKKRKEKSQN
jgi:hypothetical protein